MNSGGAAGERVLLPPQETQSPSLHFSRHQPRAIIFISKSRALRSYFIRRLAVKVALYLNNQSWAQFTIENVSNSYKHESGFNSVNSI